MKWITREHVKVDRVACPWLIRKFVDPDAEFLFVQADRVLEIAEREGAIPFDVPGVELGHHQGKSSFEAIVAKYQIKDAAIDLLAEIVHGADVQQDLYGRAEAPGLKAIAEGFRYLDFEDDHEILRNEFVVYDALYAYYQAEGIGRAKLIAAGGREYAHQEPRFIDCPAYRRHARFLHSSALA